MSEADSPIEENGGQSAIFGRQDYKYFMRMREDNPDFLPSGLIEFENSERPAQPPQVTEEGQTAPVAQLSKSEIADLGVAEYAFYLNDYTRKNAVQIGMISLKNSIKYRYNEHKLKAAIGIAAAGGAVAAGYYVSTIH